MKKIVKKYVIMVWANLAIILAVMVAMMDGKNAVFAKEVDVGDIYIKAINPGYTIDGVQNVGEMIEIGRKESDTPISLAGLAISYTNSSGNAAEIAELSKYIWRAGETLVLRLASAPESEMANVQYSKTLAFKAGPLELKWNGEVIDSVCWNGTEGCLKAFSSGSPTVLVRDVLTGEFEHVSLDYVPDYGANNLEMISEMGMGEETKEVASQCRGVEFSEILSYYENSSSEQFIEFRNAGVESVVLDGCQLKYKNKLYPLTGMIRPEEYYVRYLTDFKLTKNPTTSNVIELLDADGTVLDKLEYYNGQRKGTAYAWIGYDEKGEEIWRTTYAPTPGEANNYQEYKTCDEGKILNEATGNCVKATSLGEKICGEGQYLNLLTGRCKKIEENSTTVCKEGYYLNEETGRCRKIQENSGADYALVPETYEETKSFVALYLVIGVVAVGLVYIIYEFRHDIMRVIRRWKSKI